ncbi:MAG: AgmX/PglI C-terminal domain-containing protein [Pseudomonadota bacterium]
MSYANRMRIMPLLPWEVSPQEKGRFTHVLLIVLALTLLLGIAIPFLPTFEDDKRKVVKPPERVVKMVLEQKKKLPPPPPPKPKEEKKPEPQKKEPPKPEPKPEPKPVEVKPKPQRKPPPERAEARKQAEQQAAVFDALADLRTDDVFNKMADTSNITNAGSTAVKTQRNIIGNRANQGSGGIQTSQASQALATGSTLASRGSSQVSSRIAAQGGGGDGIRKASASGKGSERSDENIQLTFEKAKGALNSLYNRALRQDPSLQGKVVFYLEISANGKVSIARIQSSDLNNPELEKRLLAKVKRLNFGSASVATWKGNYSVDFFPG